MASYEYNYFYQYALNNLCLSTKYAEMFACAMTHEDDCACDCDPVEFNLFTQDTVTVDLSGVGLEGDPLLANVNISEFENNAILTLPDGLWVPQTLQNALLYGGVVTWLQDYDYHISAAGYYLNGVLYESPEVYVTLDPSDPVLDRIDAFIVDDTGTASVLTGVPAVNPTQPGIDIGQQLILSHALIQAGTTEPDIPQECIFEEGTEWTDTSSAPSIVLSALSSCIGTNGIEGTAVADGDNIYFTRPGGPLTPHIQYTLVTMQVKPVSWTEGRLVLQFRLAGVPVGNPVYVVDGAYGFDISSATCQIVSIPLTSFGIPLASSADEFIITADIDSGTFDWVIDHVCLQGQPVPDPPFEASDELVKISALDSEAGYLEQKLLAGGGILLIKNIVDGYETLTVTDSDSMNALIYGGVVTWLQDYDFHVSAAGYYINNVFYESPEAFITLNPSDPVLDRFDVIYVDADQVVKVLEGTPAAEVPAQPGLDLGLQLGLGVIFVEAASTQPVDLVEECIYTEVGGWTGIASDGDIVVDSLNTPCDGLAVIEATSADNGDYVLLTRGSSVAPSAIFDVITFLLKPKGDFNSDSAANHRISLQFRLAGVNVGGPVFVGNGVFGFNTASLTCQIVSIPFVQFSIPVGSSVDELKITVHTDPVPGLVPFGFFIDEVCLQGGLEVAIESDDIHNQYFGAQFPGRFWIYGHGRVEGHITSPQRIGITNTFHYLSEKFGWGAQANGIAATAIGSLATAGPYGVAVGDQAVANSGVAIGYYAQSTTASVSIMSNVSGTGAVGVGAGSVVTGGNAITIGGNSSSTGIGTIAIGIAAIAGSGYGAISIGGSSSVIHSHSLAMGSFATSTADRQVVFGADHPIWGDFGFDTLYFGRGVTSFTRGDKLWTITGSQDVDIAGDKWILAGAKGTGNALSGTFEWHTSDPTVSGSTLQSWTRKMGLNSNTLGFYMDNTRFQMDEGADVVAANDLPLGTGNTFTITGNTTVNAIIDTNWQDGAVIHLHLTGTPTLKHNTAGGAGTIPMRLAGAVDFVIAGYTVLELEKKDGFWNEVGRTIATGGGSGLVSADNALSLSTATNVQLGGPLIQNTTISGAFPIAMSDNDAHFGIGLSAATLATYVQSFAVQKTFGSGNVTAGAAYFNTNVAPSGSEFLNGINSISSYTTLDLSAGYYQGSPSADISGSVGAVLIQGNDTNQTTGFISGMHGAILVDGDINVQDIAVLKAKTPAQLSGGAGNIITNIYGLYIDAQNVLTGVTNTYGIHQVGGTDLNYLAGPTAVGDLPISGDELFKVAYPGAKFFRVDPVGGLYELGDINTSSNGTYLSIDNTNMTWTATNIPATATTDVIYYNPATGALTYGTAPTSFPGISADNGLTENVDNNVQLGGTLLQNTTINATSAYQMIITGSYASGPILQVNNTGTNNGLQGTAISGVGVRAASTSGNALAAFSTSGLAASLVINPSGTNDVVEIIQVQRNTSGTAANGIGQSIGLYNETSTGAIPISNQIISKLTDATHASRVSQVIITGVNNAVTADLLTLSGSGALQMNKYGVGSFTAGTAAYLIATDASGNWFEYPAGGVGSGLITADNGLTVNSPNNVQLGGTLLQNTTIAGSTSYNLRITGNYSSGTNGAVLDVDNAFTVGSYFAIRGTATGGGGGVGILGQVTTGYGVQGASSTGTAGRFDASSSGIGVFAGSSSGTGIWANSLTGRAGYMAVTPSSTNTIVDVLQLDRQTSGTAANGIGGGLVFNTEEDLGTSFEVASLDWKWVNAVSASRTGQLDFIVTNSAVSNTIMSAYGTGVVGIGIASGYTATRLDIVDNAATTQSIAKIASTSLSSGNALDISIVSTAATGNTQRGINVALSGANGTGSQTTVAIAGINTHSGSGVTTNIGLRGEASNSGQNNYGVFGTDGTGMAYAPATAGVAGAGVYGVYGFSSSNTGGGVYGVDTHASGGMGVFGTADGSSATGVAGVSAAGTGVKGTSDTGVPLKANLQPSAATPNTVRTLLELQAFSNSITNIPGNGYGGNITWNMITNNGGNTASRTASDIYTYWTDVIDASRTATMILDIVTDADQHNTLLLSGAQSTLYSRDATSNQTAERYSAIGTYKTLTESSATTFVRVNVPSSTVTGGEMLVTVEANDTTDFQARTLRYIWSAVNKAGTTTVTVGTPEESVAVSAGTLTVTITAIDSGSGNVDFQANAVSSLTQSVLRCSYQVHKNIGIGTITPQ